MVGARIKRRVSDGGVRDGPTVDSGGDKNEGELEQWNQMEKSKLSVDIMYVL